MLRTFRVAPGGELLPLSSSVAWRDGWNSAVCSRDSAHIPPARRCRCGFYGYWDPVSVMPSPAARHVLAVVAVHGELEIGSRGGRARYARIEALWLGARICAGLAQEVRLLYPTVMTYRDRDAMLTDFPIPRIAGLPAPRPGEAAAARMRSALWLTAALVALTSVLPVRATVPGAAAALAAAAVLSAVAWAVRSWAVAFAGLVVLVWLLTEQVLAPAEGMLYRCLLGAAVGALAIAWRRRGQPGRP